MWLYLILEILIIFFPLILSFDKKMKFYKRWKSVFSAIIIVGAFFLAWDIYFTRSGIWRFNPAYHAPVVLLNIPIEEWLFYIVVPYASIFIHYSMEFVHPKILLPDKITRIISLSIISLCVLIALINTDKTYTFIVAVVTALSVGYAGSGKLKILNRYYITFLIIMVPFVVFNGIWTGTGIKDEVFWYNEAYILGIRLFTIPVEDLAYGFCLILLVILCIHKIEHFFNPYVQGYSDDDDNE